MSRPNLRVVAVESKPALRHNPQKLEDYWGTTAKTLLRSLGNEHTLEIKTVRSTLRTGPLRAEMLRLAQGCGIPFEIFVTAVAVVGVTGKDSPVIYSTLRGNQDTRRHDTSIRDHLRDAVAAYEKSGH